MPQSDHADRKSSAPPMIRSTVCLPAVLAAALMLAVGGSRAEMPESDLSAVEREIATSRSAQDRIAAEVAAAEREREEISRRTIAISQKIQAAEAAISGGERELLRLAREQVALLARLGEKEDTLAELLAGLQRLQQNPPPALVVEPGDVLGALRGAMLFGAIVPELRAEAEALAADLDRLDRLRAGIAHRKQAIVAEIASLNVARGELDRLIARKQELVDTGNAALAAERARAAELAGKAANLKQLLAALAAERARAEAERQRFEAAAERERRLKEAALQRPRLAFAAARGRLAYPAQGQILKQFGDDDGLGGAIQGVVIATRSGAQVTAPADGRVEFAGPFRSYGQVLIIDPGGGYHILLAGMTAVTAATGEFLRAGEPVGQMGDGPSSVTLLGDVIQDRRPVLYVEFRDGGGVIDSGPWWIGGMKEARG
jgi:septal ring factor EnvC (AmiA/AmiB activator)